MPLRLAAALVLLLWRAAAFAQGTYVHSDSQLRFPGRLGGFQQGKVQDYGDPRLGISVRYDRAGLGRADVYVYDLGEKRIPPGIGSDLVKAAFRGADNDIAEAQRIGRYFDLEYLMPMGGVLKAPKGGQDLYVRAYRFRVGDMRAEPLISWLAVTGYHNKFLKIRFSHAGDRLKDGEAALNELIDAFFEANK